MPNRTFAALALAALGLAAASTLPACDRKPAVPATPMPALEARGMLRNDFATLVDVRPTADAQAAPIDGAIRADLAKLEANPGVWDTLKPALDAKRSTQFLMVGKDAAEGRRAAEVFASHGYRVGCLESYEAWAKASPPGGSR